MSSCPFQVTIILLSDDVTHVLLTEPSMMLNQGMTFQMFEFDKVHSWMEFCHIVSRFFSSAAEKTNISF
jgi:hypothetical protein